MINGQMFHQSNDFLVVMTMRILLVISVVQIFTKD